MLRAGGLLRAAGGHGGARRAAAAASLAGAFRKKARIDGVTIVATPAAAKRALRELERLKDVPHAWDTETADLQLGAGSRTQSPVCHGRVICATCFCGEDVDFGNGPRLFVDNTGPADGLLAQYFKPYFESEEYRKIFHNYSFDSHMLRRHGIELRGFHADTMHMARLYDTSRGSWEGSVKRKTGWAGGAAVDPHRELRPDRSAAPRPDARRARPLATAAAAPGWMEQPSGGAAASASRAIVGIRLGQKPMQRASYSGQSLLHTLSLPPILDLDEGQDSEGAGRDGREALQGYGLKNLAAYFGLAGEAPGHFARLFGTKATAAQEAHDSPERFREWVLYATADAVMTHGLFERLQRTLASRSWKSSVHARTMDEVLRCRKVAAELRKKRVPTYSSAQFATNESMWTLYERYIRDLGEFLADMERVGVGVDLERLDEFGQQLSKRADDCREEFKQNMACVKDSDGELLNPEAELINLRSSVQMRTLLFGGTGNLNDPSEELEREKDFKTATTGPKKSFTVKTLGLSPTMRQKDSTPLGWPKVSSKSLTELCGRSSTREQLLRNGLDEGQVEQAVTGIERLAEHSRLTPVLSGFVEPLKEFGRATGRIHPCWEWDTSTGRLACRAPNLQNLPAAGAGHTACLRNVFRAAPGKVLVVADYSQLELRVLAHIADCRSMIQKFSLGGDYHSEVAAEMFPHVRAALDAGEVVTQQDGSGKPTVKDVYGLERTKAKAVNFGIIYGMGPRSLGETLNVGTEEAKELISLWFQAKPEVMSLKTRIEQSGRQTQHAASLLGRQRHLPFLAPRSQRSAMRACISEDDERKYTGKSLRAAVNFAIQGSAADIVTTAGLQLWKNQWLRDHGFKIVMQVHDEFVLEGPEEFGQEAAERMRDVMMHPFRDYNPEFRFKVPLAVDVGVGGNFGDAKA